MSVIEDIHTAGLAGTVVVFGPPHLRAYVRRSEKTGAVGWSTIPVRGTGTSQNC